MRLEALPVVGQPLGQGHLTGEDGLPRVRHGGSGLRTGLPIGLAEGRPEGLVDAGKEALGQRAQLVMVTRVAVLGKGALVAPAKLDEEIERAHLRRLDDPVADLRVDPLTQGARIAVLVGKRASAGSAHRAVGGASMRLRPTARGSGVSSKSA